MIYLADPDVTLYQGDVIDCLRELPEQSVHMVVTSPPYFGLRDYGTGAWEGGDADHEHETLTARNGRGGSGAPGKQTAGAFPSEYAVSECSCGARRIDNQLGLESTPQEYVERMVAVFAEVWRVLRDDGVMFVNIGDSFNDKQLVGVPWRLAFALQDAGWYLRSAITWCKPNAMPESVTDRPTKATEMIFLLSKRSRYYFDAEAIRSPHQHDGRSVTTVVGGDGSIQHRDGERWPGTGANARDWWVIPTESFPDAHFATFPQKLVERCILAGTSEKGCCPECGAGWVREVDSPTERPERQTTSIVADGVNDRRTAKVAGGAYERWRNANPATTTGWRPSCECGYAEVGSSGVRQTVPAVVLDCFSGSGTTALVARRLGRRSVGIDLSTDYCAMAAKRLQQLSLLSLYP